MANSVSIRALLYVPHCNAVKDKQIGPKVYTLATPNIRSIILLRIVSGNKKYVLH